MSTGTENDANTQRDTLEALAAAEVPAPWVNRFRVVIGGSFAKIVFLEQSPEGVRTVGRAAVAMAIEDIRALSATISAVLAQADAKTPDATNS